MWFNISFFSLVEHILKPKNNNFANSGVMKIHPQVILHVLLTPIYYIEVLNLFEVDFHIWCDVRFNFIFYVSSHFLMTDFPPE